MAGYGAGRAPVGKPIDTPRTLPKHAAIPLLHLCFGSMR